MEFDIIIPVAFREYSFLSYSIPYIIENLNPRFIWIITSGIKSKHIPRKVLTNIRCKFIDEDKLLSGLSYSIINQLLLQHKQKDYRPGWYYQQFIKYAFALSEYCTTDYYLSWDADTIPINKLCFFNESGHPLFSMKYERHLPYFDTIINLLGIEKFNCKSYIAEHMMFKKSIVKDLLNAIESSSVMGEKWFEKIIFATNNSENCVFSEFETYGNYVLNFMPNLYLEREIPSFRYGGFIRGRYIDKDILAQMAYDISIVSFEAYHIPPFPWNIYVISKNFYLNKKERVVNKYNYFRHLLDSSSFAQILIRRFVHIPNLKNTGKIQSI